MPRIFMSHSSLDNRQSIALRQWLIEQDPPLADEIFLDSHRDVGIRPGERWKDALRQASASCEAVICLLSANWEASAECKTEYRFAEYLNKRIFSARIGPLNGEDPTREWQRIDLVGEGPTTEVDLGDGGDPVAFLSEGLHRLRQGIVGAGIGAESFVWPPPNDPDRAPYRGWEALEEVDAAVFFGRDAQILRGLDAVRGMRTSGVETMFVVLGPSGTGKSSFLRAGLLPRLRRDDRDFLILDIVRPKRDVLTGDTGFARAIQATRSRVGLRTPSLGVIKRACLSADVTQVRGWLLEAQRAASAQLLNKPDELPLRTLVLPVDQGEELFGADAGIEAPLFLELIGGLAGGANDDVGETDHPGRLGLIVAVTIRTDRFQALQEAPQLAGVGSVVFDELKPMPGTQFKEVITGPATRATQSGRPLLIEPELVNKLLDDCTEGADTLPLLALTLARLYEDYRRDGTVDEQTPNLTLADYESMGGMRHVVHTVIDGLLATDREQRATELELLRAAFIPWLATINPDNDQPMRRVARWSDLPAKSRPLLEKFVAKRLLIEDDRHGEVVVEVALESLLRQWDELAAWLADEREDLKAADTLERTAAAWDKNHRDDAWLLQGTRLAEAEALAAKPGFADRLEPTLDYLHASRQREDERIEAERQHREAELQAAKDRQEAAEKLAAAETAAKEEAQGHAVVLRKRSRVLRAVLAATAIVAIIAVVGFGLATYSWRQAQQRTREATAQRIASEGLSILNGDRPGGDTRAVQEMLAASSLSPGTIGDVAVTAAMKLSWASKVISPPGRTAAAAYSPDGRRIASGGFDRMVRIWDADTGSEIGQPLSGHTGTVTSVAFSPDGRRVVSASADGSLRLWDVATGKQVGAPITASDQSPDGPSTVWAVAFSPDGKRIASGGADKMVRLWDANTGQPLGPPLSGHTDSVLTVVFSPVGDMIASAGKDRTVRIWNADTGKPIGEPLMGQSGNILSVAFSPDGQRMASASTDKTVWIWDQVQSGAPVGHPLVGHYASGRPVVGHTAAVTTVGFSNTGKSLVSGSVDGTIRWWFVNSGYSIQLPGARRGDNVQAVAFRPGKLDLMSCSAAGGVRLWSNIELAFPLEDHTDNVTGVAFSPDGQVIASSSDDQTVRLWRLANSKTGIPTGDVLRGHTKGVGWVAFSPDGRRIVSAGWDGTIRLWDTATGAPIGVIDSHTGSVAAVAFSPDGHRIVSADADNNLQMWNPDTGQPIGAPLTGHTAPAEIVVFSPDGHLIASGSDDRTIRLWDAETGKQVAQLTGHTDDVYSVSFSPDGRRLVSGSWDGTVRIWDVDKREEISQPLNGQAGRVYVVVFSPNGRYIASGGEDGTVRIWNAQSGDPAGAPLTLDTYPIVDALAFSADGSRLVSAGSDEDLHLWPFPVDARDTLCSKIAANMSHKQWDEWVSPHIGYIKQCPQLPIAPDE